MADVPAGTYEDFFYRSPDGLRLAGRDYHAAGGRLPVVCLPGLTRTVRDFHDLATTLSTDPGRSRRVVALDYRGRGRSDYDPDPTHYNPLTEMNDVMAGLADRGIERAAFVGTSRGGIVTMLLAGAQPDLVAGAILNDIGSIIEPVGLLRIKSYVGRLRPPRDWADAVAIAREVQGAFFPAFTDADWEAQARTTYRDVDGRPTIDADPALAQGLDAITPDMAPIDLSAAFGALAHVPVMVIRGERSDLLSEETVAAMAAAHPGLVEIVVPGEGHAPVLRDRLLGLIAHFLDRLG